VAKDRKNKAYTLKPTAVRPEDFWVTHPVSYKTIISLPSYTPVPTFENHLIIHGELES
jgi:hypothetical protein